MKKIVQESNGFTVGLDTSDKLEFKVFMGAGIS